ncbi:polysaccharide biosynthesis protein [Myroides sp. M-43]|uniref:polysaccharide biosynthesis protein n=1 Tax=Myroides oncorhynchi TaxID=2893756 RepID=UPI001E3A1766|nr:nucleoside-diphosphate sugar epimerase/dehydratase [Myroides oncorhynchi]MCC9043194.1 polysaccharide biosynthesis protein [Myroides oncorhynchi]
MSNALKRQLKRDTPRGIIFSIDLLIVLFTYFISSILLTNFFGNFSLELMVKRIPVLLVCYIISFMIFKPFKGVIRQTSTKDIENIFISCLFSGAVVMLISSLQRNEFLGLTLEDYLRYSYSFVLLHLFFTSGLLILARLFYSQFYRSYVLDVRNHKRVIIYGAGDSGIITVGALQGDTKIRTHIVGFVDDNSSKSGNRLAGYRIYNPSILDENYILTNRIDEIIISIQNITRERLNDISEVLEKLPVKIKIIPPATDWLDGSYTNKQIKELKIDDLLGRKAIQLDNPIIAKEIDGKVVLITGAAGSIGSEIARQVARFNFKKLILVDHAESPLYDVQQTMVSDKCSDIIYVVGNIRDEKKMDTIFDQYRPSLVYHAAAYKHVPLMESFPYEAIHTNVKGTKVIADLSVEYKVQKFVMVSTDKAVNPTNVMGATKRAAEIYVSSLTDNGVTSFIVTRFGNVLGSNGSVIPLFKRQIDLGGPLTVTHQDITRFFMTIPEACQLVLEASIMGHGGEIFVFDMGKSMKIFDLAKRMIRLSGFSYPEDIDIKITGLRPGEKIFEELLANDENTVKTHHEKIMIAKVRSQDLNLMKVEIELMCENVCHNQGQDNVEGLVKQLKSIVPEFKSQNSRFECLDKVEECSAN